MEEVNSDFFGRLSLLTDLECEQAMVCVEVRPLPLQDKQEKR